MKYIRVLNGRKLVNHFSAPISYKTAFVLSLLLHGLALVILTFLLNPIELRALRETALVIDFVSAPGSENDQVSAAITKQSIQQSPQLTNYILSGSHSTQLRNQFIEDNTSAIQPTEHDDSMNEVYETRDSFDQRHRSQSPPPYFANILMTPHLKFPRIDNVKPKLLPAKLPVSVRQEKTLIRKVQKVAENFHETKWSDTTFVVEDEEQKFEIQIQQVPAKSETALDELLFDIITEENGKMLATQMRMRRLAFSNFAQLIDHWDPQVALHDDKFEGRFHSNYAFAISRRNGISPQFHGKVTTAAYDFKTSGNFPIIDQSSIFMAGFETGVKQVRLPKTFSPFSNQAQLMRDQVHVFDEETWLTFQKDGTYTWKSKSSPAGEHHKKIPDISFFIVGNSGAKIHVKGTVKGKVLVYSADYIIIDGALLYARSPQKFPNSDDYLGLVSEKNIEIAPPSVTGPGDLHLYAAIYARGWFRVPNLSCNAEATLHIYGSLSAGALTATEPRYATRICFDNRLETQRPPNFPMTETYEIIEWEKEWEIREN